MALPHGANGIDVGDFVILFLRDKIMVARKGASEHFTVHFGGHSGELDVHRTWRDQAGTEHHLRLYAIRSEHIRKLLEDLIPLLNEFLSLRRPLDFEELDRGGIRVVMGMDPVTNDQIEAVTLPHKRRLRVDPSRLRERVEWAHQPRDLRFSEDGGFSLFQGRHRVGMGVKGTGPFGHSHILWFKLSDLRRFLRDAVPRVERIFRAYQKNPTTPVESRIGS